MGTDVEYNGIKMTNVVTRNWDQEMVYDQSGSDLIGNRFHLTFEGILHTSVVEEGSYDSADYGAPAWVSDKNKSRMQTDNQGTLYDYVYRKLCDPRRDLRVWMNDQLVLAACPASQVIGPDYQPCAAPSYRDVDNGPKPKNVRITHVASNKVFRVSFSVDVCLLSCPGDSSNHVTNNRWSVSETMDENFFITRTISGYMRLSDTNRNPQAYKNMIVFGLEYGFKRERITFTSNANGLECEYEVVDRQVHTCAPWPATSISGSHSERTNDGITYVSEVNVRLQGSPEVDKKLLVQRALQVADNRLNGFLSNKTGEHQMGEDYEVLDGTVTDWFGEENAVEVHFSIKHLPNNVVERLSQLYIDNVGSPLEVPTLKGQPYVYDPRRSRVPATYGYNSQTEGERDPQVALALFYCYNQTRCSDIHQIVGPMEFVKPVNTDEPEPVMPSGYIIEGDYHPTQQNIEYKETPDRGFTYSKISSTYHTRKLRVTMPVIGTANSAMTDAMVGFTLGPSQCIREYVYEAECMGAYPYLPEPVEHYIDIAYNLHGYLLDVEETFSPPIPCNNGRGWMYFATVRYRYALNRAPTRNDLTRVGVHPFTNRTEQINSVNRNTLYDASRMFL